MPVPGKSKLAMRPDSAHLHEQVVSVLRDVAQTLIVPRFNRLTEDDVRSKSHPGDLVTIADEEAERALHGALKQFVPWSQVVGEEAVAADSSLLGLLAGDDPVWLIDPIDGTANFVNGIARFAIMVALIHRGETIMGWIHEPLGDATLTGELGAGAWHTSSAGSIAARHLPPGPAAFRSMEVALHNREFAGLIGQFARNVRLGSAAHDYWALVEGRLQILSYRRLKPWDHAAGILIHQEAGGYSRLLNREPYRPAMPDQQSLLCTPNAAVWEDILAQRDAKLGAR